VIIPRQQTLQAAYTAHPERFVKGRPFVCAQDMLWRGARGDAGRSFRDALATDIRDIRSVVGAKHNAGIRSIMGYHRNSFSNLTEK
jgi:hypothetical protein